jgi:hypothetical protein
MINESDGNWRPAVGMVGETMNGISAVGWAAGAQSDLGLNLNRSSELPITVTELRAMAPAAKKGRTLYTLAPKMGTKAPAATGMRTTL